MKRIFKKMWLYLIVVLLVALPWFLQPGYLFFTDFVLGPKIILDWQSNQFFLKLLFKLFSFVLPMDLAEKLFFVGVLLLILLAGRFLLKQLLIYFSDSKENKYYGMLFVLSLFLLFNPFVYDRIMYGQWGVVLGYGFFISTIGYLFKSVNEPQSRSLIFVWLFTGLAIMSAQHFVFLLLPFLILFYYLYFKNRFDLKRVAKYSIIGVVIFFIVNLNWLAPLFINNKSGNLPLVGNFDERHYEAFKTSGGTATEVFKNVIMMSGFWGKDQFRYLDLTKINDNWGRSFLLLLPVIIFGVYKSLKEAKIRSLSVGLLIAWAFSIFLAAGMGTNITRGITLWLFEHILFYSGLRETQKWVAPAVLVYVFYLSYGIWQLFFKKFIQNYKFILSVFLGGVIIMQAPLLLWGLNGQVVSTKYPADWHKINQKITEDSNCQKNILFFPWHLYMSFKWVGQIIANPAPVFFTCPVISGVNMEWGSVLESANKNAVSIDDWAQSKNNNLLDITKKQNIGYIILAKEVDYRKYLPKLQEKVEMGELSVFSDTETLLVFKVNN